MKKIFLWGSATIIYLGLIAAGTMLVHGRSLQEWVTSLVPPGRLQELLMYPLQHHHPLTFAKLIVAGDVLVNIFLFIPLGVIIFLVFDRVFMYSRTYVCSIAVLSGASFSICIELVQYMVPNRIPSVSDVLANVTGAFLGASLFYIRRWLREKLPGIKAKFVARQSRKSVSKPQP